MLTDIRAKSEASWANVLFGSILLQKSTRLGLRAKMRNNRIGTDEFLNQRCVVVFDLESILLAHTLKIVLQRICHFRTRSAY